jgi:hypothetical protein
MGAVVLHNVRVNANLAMSGGGAIHVWNGTAECDECDLGEGVEDNAPQDVLAAGTDFCFGDGVSFQCSATAGCTTDEAQDCTAE